MEDEEPVNTKLELVKDGIEFVNDVWLKVGEKGDGAGACMTESDIRDGFVVKTGAHKASQLDVRREGQSVDNHT